MDEEINFLYWLSKRLIYLHKYQPDDLVIKKLNHIVDYLKSIHKISTNLRIALSDQELDKIINKYYIDFDLEKTQDNNISMGFTDMERCHIRAVCRNLVNDVNDQLKIKEKGQINVIKSQWCW